MDRSLYMSKKNSKRVIKLPFSSNNQQTFYDLIDECIKDPIISKKLSLFKDVDYCFSLGKFDEVNINNFDRITDFNDYFRNEALTLIIDEIPDSDVTVIDEDDTFGGTELRTDTEDDSETNLVTNHYEEEELIKVAEKMTMAYNVDGHS